ncbi:MAG: ROK family protein [Anaerolineae bacterium]
MKQAVIGVDIGGTKIAGHISVGSLSVLHDAILPSPQEAKPEALAGIAEDHPDYPAMLACGRNAIMQTVITLCRDLQAYAHGQGYAIVAVGVGTAGQVNPQTGVILDANPNIVGWVDTPLGATLRDALDLPIYIENDVRTMALAETALGAGYGYAHVLCITVGTGIGGAIVLNGQLWHGAHFSAGEIGYTYAAAGETIETLYSGVGIAHQYNQMHHTHYDLRKIASLAHQGDQTCIDVIAQSANRLGQCLAPIIGLIDPQVVVIGGGVPTIGDLWWQPFTDAISAFTLKSVQETPILPAKLGNRAGMIGAGVLAIQKVRSQ